MSMARGWFVTGTDTGAGKTLVSAALLTAMTLAGRKAVGMKPVASACEQTAVGLRSADAEMLLAAGNVAAEYTDVNPYAFAAATAPHLAAADSMVAIHISTIRAHYLRLAARADHVMVEGIGGWLVPISATETMADVVHTLALPVILVVGLRLGAINHALLTREAILARGCRLVAWVANAAERNVPDGYVETLRELLGAPLLGVIPHGATTEEAASSLDLCLLEV
jgi:dethiobiotin synthetase